MSRTRAWKCAGAVVIAMLLGVAASAFDEISKTGMTATGTPSPWDGWGPDGAIDGLLTGGGTAWITDVAPAYVQIDLGARYLVQQFGQQPRVGNHECWTKDYEIYVTDDEGDWGTPVAAGTFLNENSRQTVTLASPKNGQYVILYAVSGYASGQSGASEVWVFGDAVTNYVQEFMLADKTSGSNLYTNADSVNVTLAGGGGTEPYQFIIGADAGTKPAASDPGWGNPASVSLSAFFTPLTDGEDYTLFAWTKDADGTISAAKEYTILYNSLTPAVSNVNITQGIDPTATVTWDTDSESYGRIRYKEFGTGTWVVGPYEASHGLNHSVAMLNICPGKTYACVIENNEAADVERSYVRGYGEIPKVRMTATTNNVRSDDPNFAASKAIDSVFDTGIGWLAEITNGWLKLDLGDRYQVQRFDYNPRPGDAQGRIQDYEIYVTDVDSISKDDWGTPVAAGTFLNENSRQTVTLASPRNGRYVILYAVSGYASGQSGASEVWVYGDGVPQVTVEITEFTVSDQSTGSTLFTNMRDVNVAVSVETIGEATVDGYLISESGTPPEGGWFSTAPTSYSITGPEGSVTVYAWVLSGTTTTSATSTILFSTAAPVVSNVLVTDNGDDTATATWTTDIPAQGCVQFGPALTTGGMPNTVLENAIGTEHSVTFATAAGVNYKIALVSNEVADAPFYWPGPWPISGDANMDCRVNILDLIFIRNKLNQDAATGDNWKADVNEDTRINILDLIFVRNKLNTQCP
ncbi:MAG TPA: discoidin domain-containing protein [Planctomycetota bacterium]|nr:discoidin domain-containing protein [Planctomycetota bacterium]